MVEATGPSQPIAQAEQPLADQVQAPPEPKAEIGMCEHEDLLATYCKIHDMALCNDCYFDDHGTCGRGMTLKQASTNQIEQFESMLTQINASFNDCKNMKQNVVEQEGIEEEVIKKVTEQYSRLTEIVNEQREEAFLTIKNLESI